MLVRPHEILLCYKILLFSVLPLLLKQRECCQCTNHIDVPHQS